MADFETFMQKVMERPLPSNGMARIKTLAKELVEGAVDRLWFHGIIMVEGPPVEYYDEEHDAYDSVSPMQPDSFNVREYLRLKWNDVYPSFKVLEINDYLNFTTTPSSRYASYRETWGLTKKSFELLGEVEPSTIFISYRRKESSAFALLVLARLKVHGLDAFVDMAIKPGDNWHAHIKEQIESHDFFIVLLSHETLDSDVVRDEIQWAMDAKKAILPIAHPSFDYAAYKTLKTAEGKFKLSPEMDFVLTNTHTIRVLEESALAYNNAIVELLNRFGITP